MKYVLLATCFLTALSAFAEESSSGGNDTYNFYFQKAPGPVTVNQGGSAPAPKNFDPAAPAAAPAAGGNVVAAVPEAPADDRSRWKLYLGYSSTGEGSALSDDRPSYMSWASDNAVSGQYVVGVEFEPIKRVLAIQAEGRYLKAVPDFAYANQQARYDWGAGLVGTPLRFDAGRTFGLALSAMAGVVQVPYVQWIDFRLAHVASPYFGARASIELGQKVALEASVRKITKFDNSMATFTVGFLL